MDIRAFAQGDEEQVVTLWRNSGLVVPWNDLHLDISRKLAKDPELFLVGTEENDLVATVMGGYDGHRGWINYLAVADHCRGRHYGRQMMAAVEALLRQQGYPKINLQVRSTNDAVIGFYRAIGYLQDDVVGMGKRLSE